MASPKPARSGRDAGSARLVLAALACALATSAAPVAVPAEKTAPPAPAARPTPAWVERSNENTRLALEIQARYGPEFAGQLGVPGLDEEISDLKPDVNKRLRKDISGAAATFKARLKTEKDPAVRQDLEILIEAGEDAVTGIDLSEKYQIPYFGVSQLVFNGVRTLLDYQVDPKRRPAALVRLRKYAGVEPGGTPVTQLAMDRTRERLETPGLLGPSRAEVERDLADGATYVDGIAKLFEKYRVAGFQEAHGKLKQQIAAYDDFVRKEILPRAREDFRLPPELYAFSLKQFGIDMPVEELVSRAQVAFMEIRNEMLALAPLVAKEKGFTVTDYRGVIRELKKKQLVGDAILAHYQGRIKDLEGIVARERVVTLPEREMRIRIASEAEAANTPAPNMRPPRLIGNTGEMGEFVLPLTLPGREKEMKIDDFTFEAASWTLTVHEGRPGHELQFASLVEKGVSLARAIYAFNSVNVEGWALYTEAEMKPYMPLEGQLISLQARLLRAARAFLDPGLQMGTVTREEAMHVLRDDVALSEAMATQEVERYTFRAPGQAPSYFCGYNRLMQLRAEVERALGEKFDRRKYHDFILAQGLLPPRLLRKALTEAFIPSQTGAGTVRSANPATPFQVTYYFLPG